MDKKIMKIPFLYKNVQKCIKKCLDYPMHSKDYYHILYA